MVSGPVALLIHWSSFFPRGLWFPWALLSNCRAYSLGRPSVVIQGCPQYNHY